MNLYRSAADEVHVVHLDISSFASEFFWLTLATFGAPLQYERILVKTVGMLDVNCRLPCGIPFKFVLVLSWSFILPGSICFSEKLV